MNADIHRSELGVLMSLLYQILDSKKDLIAVAFPDRFNALIMSRNQQPMAGPTKTELKKGLPRLIQECPPTSFFLAINCLDEYEGDQAQMKPFGQHSAGSDKYPNVKAVLSNRPWMAFEESFAGCLRLLLHDLTCPHFVRFVDDKLAVHPHL